MASNHEITRKVVWYWQSNTNSFSKPEGKEWTRYTERENEHIEEAYLNKDDKVSMNQNYYIDLKNMLQVSKHDKNKQRPVKRENDEIQQFSTEQQPIPPPTSGLGAPGEKLKFVDEWIRQNSIDSHYFNEQNAEEIVLKAAEGIEAEGKLFGKENEGVELSKLLRDSKNYSLHELSQKCIYAYTMDSFLYQLVNQCLKEDDMSKITTLGPFCFLLVNALWLLRRNGNVILYRGVNLTEDQLNNYKANVGKEGNWKAFMSTTSVKKVAEEFGSNTLFIISVVQMPFKPAYWTPISEYSGYPDEHEVLLPAAVTYIINKITYDNEMQKHLIFVTI